MNAHSQDPQSADNPDLEQRVTHLETRFDAVLPTLATKADVQNLRSDFEAFRGDMRAQAEKDRSETATRFEALRGDMRAQFEEFCGRMRTQAEKDRGDMATRFEVMRGDLRAQSEQFRSEMSMKFEELRGQTHTDSEKFRAEIIGIVANYRADLYKWVTKLLITLLLGLLGVCFAMFTVLKTMIDTRVPPSGTVERSTTIPQYPPLELRPR